LEWERPVVVIGLATPYEGDFHCTPNLLMRHANSSGSTIETRSIYYPLFA